MNTQTIAKFDMMSAEMLEVVAGGVPYGWYSVFPGISNNLICRNGYAYNHTNMQNGNCGFDWSNIAGNVGRNIGAAFGDLHNPLP